MVKLTRRALVLGAPALAVAGRSAARPAERPLTMLAVGDWGRDGTSHQRDVAVRMGHAAAANRSRMIISVGDNFYEDGVQSATDPQWRTSFEDIYTDPALQVPWQVVLGNHDYRGVPQAQLEYARTSSRWRLPRRYYKVSGAAYGAPHADLFFIDTSPLVHKYRSRVEGVIAANVASQDPALQLRWLAGALGASRAAWKIVVGHHTVYSGGSGHGNTPELVAQLAPLLERHGVQVYINGHDHDLQHLRVGRVDYICTGAGSEVRPTSTITGTRFALAQSGFAALSLDRDALALSFIDFTGATVYAEAIPRARPSLA